MNDVRSCFELRRRIDGLVYKFDRVKRSDGSIGYKRRDKDYWINWHSKLGWVVWDGESEYIGGRPWYALPEKQSNFPPEGVWVSMKGDKSFVYDLEYQPSIQ